jgi:golgi-specific brefeldin A-resistance guanine nucleotide exchange factor 1
MSLTDYERNIRGLNDGVDFPAAFVNQVYHAIKENEIVLAEEHGDSFMHQFASITKQMNSLSAKPVVLHHLDRMVIKSEWKQICACLFYCNSI